VINLDTNTAIAFVAQGSAVRVQLRAFVQNQQLVMVQTAFDEFVNILQYSGVLRSKLEPAASSIASWSCPIILQSRPKHYSQREV
jgi:hypothetical protein